jgi:hypothetical protein
MQLAIVAALSVLALGVIALFSAVRLALDVRAIGQPSGAWVVAFGFELGFLQLAGVTQSAAALELDTRVFGRRWRFGGKSKQRTPDPVPARPKASRKLPPWLDPVDAALFLLDERRRVTIERLDVELDYGFRDVVLTGKIAGALYALSGVLPERIRIVQRPSWGGGEAWQAQASGRIAFWPGLVLAEVLWYMLRARSRWRPEAPEAEPARGTAA